MNPPQRKLQLGYSVTDFPDSDYMQLHPDIEGKPIRLTIKLMELHFLQDQI